MKAILVGALALLMTLPAATTTPNVAVADIVKEAEADHLLVGLEDDNANCGGTAPASTACSTGEHLRAGGGFFGPGSGDGCPTACSTTLPGYTGTLKMDITYYVHSNRQLMQTRTNTCHFNAGVVLSCVITGAPAPVMPQQGATGIGWVTVYAHKCESFDLGTGTPGGAGPWMCFAWHGLLT